MLSVDARIIGEPGSYLSLVESADAPIGTMYMMLHVGPFLVWLSHTSHIEGIFLGYIPLDAMNPTPREKPYSIKGLGRLRMMKRQE